MDWLRSFDPNPLWYIWSLHTVVLVSFPIYFISMFCILRVNIVSNPTYKYLLAVNVTTSYVTQLSLSEGTVPILTLHCPGGYPVGLLTQLGFSTCLQLALVQCLMIGNGLSTTALFFYRSHMASPFSRFYFYGIIWLFVVGSLLVPSVLNISLCDGMRNATETALYLQNNCPNISAVLPNQAKSGTLLIIPNVISVHLTYSYFGCLMIACVILIIFFNYRASVTLRRQIFSHTTVTMHKTLVRCLVIQTTVYYSLFSIPVVIILGITGIKLNLPTAANLAFIVLSLSDPTSSLALMLGHKKYRSAIFRPFKGERKAEVVSRN